MKNLSIKQRVTLYYAAVFLLITGLVIGGFYAAFGYQTNQVSQLSLERAVKNAFDFIETPGDWLEISPDFDFYVDDVTLLVYGPEGTLMLGHEPQSFPQNTALRSDEHQSINTTLDQWQVYDLYTEYPNGLGVWVRGIHSLSSSAATLRRALITMLLAMPLLILFALLLGYRVTRRAFTPIEKIQQTARAIERDRDLSRRINLPSERIDELSLLGSTFDDLFDQLETAFNREKQFTSDVSHELRTPISVIISQAEFGLDHPDDPALREQSLQAILQQSRQMSQLVTHLLELSRAARGADLMHPEPINLAELCEMVAEELAEKAAEHDIRIIQKLDPDIVLTLDQTQMVRALINLMQNGIEHGHAGGFIMLDLQRRLNAVHLIVSDDGHGIPVEHLPHIFDRFYQVDTARTARQNGNSGLGLTMVRQIIENHGGTIEVQSTEGVGSTFTIILPDQPSDEPV